MYLKCGRTLHVDSGTSRAGPSTSSTMMLRLAQRAARAHARGGVVHVGDVLADPVVELALEVGALLPRPDLLALQHLQVVRQAVHDEHVRELRAEAVVGLRRAALGLWPKYFGFCTELAEKKHALSESLRKVRPMKPSSESSYSRRSVSMHLGRDLRLDLAHRLVLVEREVLDRAAGLRADDVRAPAVLGEAVGDTRVANAKAALPQRYESCLPTTSSSKLNAFTGWCWRRRAGAAGSAASREADVARVFALAEACHLAYCGPSKRLLRSFRLGRFSQESRGRRTSGRPPR
jgi:hypothetical protein